MTLQVSGDGACSDLQLNGVNWNQGTQTINITPSTPGGYIDCELTLIDHGANASNVIILPSFIYALGNYTICYDPAITVDTEECIALIDLYENTNGENWNTESDANPTNDWAISTDVSEWFGITVSA
jgi:hypothetical protein